MFVWSLTFQKAQKAMKYEGWRTRSAGGKVFLSFFVFTECSSSTTWRFTLNIRHLHLYQVIFPNQKMENSCLKSYALFSAPFWTIFIQSLVTKVLHQPLKLFCPFHHFSKFCPKSKQENNNILASTSLYQVYKLIHSETAPVNRNPCSAARSMPTNPHPQHTHDANWPATKSPRWPISKVLDCLWWFKLLHNPGPDLVTAAYTWRDLLCDVQLDL